MRAAADPALRPASPQIAPAVRPGGLRPAEVANAGVFGALAVIIVSVGSFLPHLGVIMLLSAVPFAVVGLRYRARAVVAAAVAAAFVAFLVAGVFASVVIAGCAALGGPCGIIRRRGHGSAAVAVLAAVLAPGYAALVVGLSYLFAAARALTIGTISATVAGLVHIAEILRLPTAAGNVVLRVADSVLGAWPVVIAVVMAIGVLAEIYCTNAFVRLAARRVEWLAQADPFDAAALADSAAAAPVAPVPLQLVGVGLHRAGRGRPALAGVDLTVAPGEFVAVVGPNGVGKSTLVSLLAGAAPTSGTVARPGRVGLGLPGGTAVVGQRVEAQVIGSTVAEDLRWGLPPGYPVDVDDLLGSVGLAGLAAASTESLSGGQLQRLALAAAMARRPALLISDESTSMLDTAGRAEILDLLAALPARLGTAVVHVTHDPAEAARADRVVRLADGRLAGQGLSAESGPVVAGPVVAGSVAAGVREVGARPGRTVISVRGVGHRFDAGTPWEVTALRRVDLEVREGEGLLITGENGSGKSTLAWLLAGLARPTQGSVTVDGVPAADCVGTVALSFQHARLQLQRPTVAEDILAAAGRHAPPSGAGSDMAGGAMADGHPVDGDTADRTRFVAESLARVGLPAGLAGRSVDELSGGQARRVAIAGLLAARPRVLVLDEPLAGLDRESRRGLLELLGHMRRAAGLTLVVISHDLEDMSLACDRAVEVAGGATSPPQAPPGNQAVSDQEQVDQVVGERAPGERAVRRRARPRRGGLVLRALPGTSPLHRVGPVAKIAVLAAATLASLVVPEWPTIVALAVLLAAGVVAARLPLAVVPRLPWPVTAILVLGGVAAAAGSGLSLYVQSLLLTAQFFALSLLLIWTTRVEDLPAAFARAAGPLRWLGAPVGEWAYTVTFAVRTLPLLREEFRVLIAARRLRAPGRAAAQAPGWPAPGWLAPGWLAPGGPGRAAGAGRALADIAVAVVASAGRRASDLGRTATTRGGMRPPG